MAASAEKVLIKVDKNGSKHYEVLVDCPRCGGSGVIIFAVINNIPVPTQVDNGVCWKCGGTGKVWGKQIERTPEYEAKLEARRKAKAEKKEKEHQEKLDQIRKEWLVNHGFTEDGQTFVFLGDTYSKKDEINAAGAKFDIALGWHIDHKIEGFQFITANISEVAADAYYGYSMRASKEEWDAKKKQAQQALGMMATSEHLGEIGQKLSVKVKYVHTSYFDSRFGRNYFHKFVDENGNILTWKTTSFIDEDYGTEFTLSGTVKEHTEYKGDKQTVMTRCTLKMGSN